ncbi:MAG: hypothetical protein ACLF0P_17335 [Thermoanaerobaculia bacterium]
MEFVVVKCSDDADLPVYVDSVESGRTGEVLEVQRGTHSFALCPCSVSEHDGDCGAEGYRPVTQTLPVSRTVAIDPLEVRFEKV